MTGSARDRDCGQHTYFRARIYNSLCVDELQSRLYRKHVQKRHGADDQYSTHPSIDKHHHPDKVCAEQTKEIKNAVSSHSFDERILPQSGGA